MCHDTVYMGLDYHQPGRRAGFAGRWFDDSVRANAQIESGIFCGPLRPVKPALLTHGVDAVLTRHIASKGLISVRNAWGRKSVVVAQPAPSALDVGASDDLAGQSVME